MIRFLLYVIMFNLKRNRTTLGIVPDLWSKHIITNSHIQNEWFFPINFVGPFLLIDQLKPSSLNVLNMFAETDDGGDSGLVHLSNRQQLASEFGVYFKENRPNLVICRTRKINLLCGPRLIQKLKFSLEWFELIMQEFSIHEWYHFVLLLKL